MPVIDEMMENDSDSDYEVESKDSPQVDLTEGIMKLKCNDEHKVLQRIDLIGDFGGRELFVIDGDSLLAYFLLKSVSRDHFLSPIKREHQMGQILEESCVLYMIYLIEKFIEEIRLRGGRFHIVFFEMHGYAFCQEDFRLSAYRSILRRHLMLNSDHKVAVFQSWIENSQWKEYITKYRPLFVMTYGELGQDELGPNVEFKEYSDCNEGFVLDCLERKISVAFMPDLVLEGGRIIAYVEYFHNLNKETKSPTSCLAFFQSVSEKIKIKDSDNQQIISKLAMVRENFGKFKEDCRLALCVTFLVLNENLLSSPIQTLLGKMLLLQSLTLKSMPLSYRCLPAVSAHEDVRKAAHQFLMEYYRMVYHSLNIDELMQPLEKITDTINIFDLVDEKLIVYMTQIFINEESKWENIEEAIKIKFKEEWDNVLRMKSAGNDQTSCSIQPEIDQLKTLQFLVTPKDAGKVNLDEESIDSFLTIQNDLFSEFYPLEKNVDPSDDEEEIPVMDDRYLHFYKEIEIEKEELDWKKRKQLQKYMAFVHKYADSLTGVKGLYNKVIVPKTRTGEDPKKKKNVSGASMKLQADNQKRMDEQRFLKAADVLKALRTHIQTVSSINEKLTSFKSRELKIKELGNDELWLAANWLKLQVLVNDWIDFCQSTKVDDNAANNEDRGKKAAGLLEQLGVIVNQCSKTLANMPELIPELNSVCRLMGFPELFQAEMFSADQQVDKKDNKKKQDKKSASKQKKPGKIEEPTNPSKPCGRNKEIFPTLKVRTRENTEVYKIGMQLPQFQLKYLGGYMNRCNASGTVDDSRVPFRPDDWQVQLLDIVDKNESALICAPTSSGKTYVAYYAMERVIAQNDEDIVVYVAPTKALVNQVATEVYARFKKTYLKGGQNVWGNWTMEYNYYPMDCQILVTVPEMLEILLLAPTHLEWSRRIKRVIFDEIHCMGQLDGGRVWEHLLLMCTMPILCLSATLGSPELFQSWLQSIQARHGINVHLVKCAQRHSDLAKYSYEFPSPRKPGKERRSRPKGAFVAVHPWGSLTTNMVLQSGIPDSAKLSPEECLMVSDIMRSEVDLGSSALFPENYFDSKSFIKRSQAFEYERALKTFIIDIAKSNPEKFQKIINSLGQRNILVSKPSNEPSIFSKDTLPDIANLAFDLRDQGMLPAICFSFTRNENESMAKSLTSTLLVIEKVLRDMDPDYEKKKAVAINEMENRLKMKKKASAKETTRQKKDQESGEVDEDRPLFNYDKPHPYCTFVGRNHSVSEDDLESYISDFEYKLRPEQEYLIEAMRRGIAVHHAGMMARYRRAVEALMRSGYLTLVFGASTLALGINMPCRTAVFFGDSIDLTPSEYQQMSGRAGRRGFDQEGYVVFANIQREKIDRLMCSELPALTGHFPLTTTLVMRMLLLLTQAVPNEDPDTISARKRREAIAELDRHKKDLVQAQVIVRNLTLNSLFCMGKVIPGDQTLHYLGASVAYLRKQNLIDYQGFLTGHSGLAVHLYSMEPSNLAFITLLNHGVFDDVCKNVIEDPDTAIMKLAFLMCHLFNKVIIPLHKVSELKVTASKSPSSIFLEPLPRKIAALIEHHNKEILAIYQDYCRKASNSIAEKQSICFLPSSRIQFAESNDSSSAILTALETKKNSSTALARSPLSSLSGKGHEFETIDDMVANIREGIHLERSAIPILSTAEGQAGRLNAYILDFLKHSHLSVIEKDNCIKEGDSWELLKDFGLALKAICLALTQRKESLTVAFQKQLQEGETTTLDTSKLDNVLKGFQLLKEAFDKQFSKHN